MTAPFDSRVSGLDSNSGSDSDLGGSDLGASDSDLGPVELAPGTSYRGLVVGEVVSRSGVGVLYHARGADGAPRYLRVLDAARVDTDELVAAKADLAKLRGVVHRSVARVLEEGVAAGELHYTLEAQGTTTLLELVRAGRGWDEPELVWLARGLAAGLAALHAAGLHHGGLTPGAVVLTPHGPILVDLGWADRLGSAEQLPPQQAQRADLVALGELLAFAAEAGGEGPLRGRCPRLGPLAARLALDAPEPFAQAEQAARALAALGEELRLPDPIAPAGLRAALGGGSGSGFGPSGLGASGEHDPLARSAEGATPLVQPTDLSPLMVSEERGLGQTSDSESDLGRFDSASDVTALGGPPVGEESDSGLLASADRRRDTLAYARAALEQVEEEDALGAPSSGVLDVEVIETSRSDRGEAPPLGAFGAYELVRQVEAFPNRTRFLATHPEHPRGIELDVLVPGALPEDAERRRFLRGAESAQAVDVPGVARVYDAGLQDGWCYLACERTSAPSLAELLADDAWAGGRAPALLARALRLLERAHHQGVVHGALEPEALHLTSEGQVRLSGFGFARLPSRARPARRYYEEGERDEAADLLACGRILYEALTGRLPAETPGRWGLPSPPPPSAQDPGLAPALDAICLTALGVGGPGYRNAGEFAEDLEGFALGARHARPLDGRTRWGLTLARGGVALVGAVAVAGAGALLAGVGAASLLRGEAVAPAARPAPQVSPEPDRAALAEAARLRREQERLSGELAARERELNESRQQLAELRAGQARLEASDALRWVEAGEAALAHGEPEAAERAFTEALRRSPGHARAERGQEQARAARAARAEQPTPSPQPDPGQEPEAAARARAEAERAERAAVALEQASAHLTARRYEEARAAALVALGAGEPAARELLERVRAAALGARRERAASLAQDGRELLRRGEQAAAAERLLEAHALDPAAASRDELRRALASPSGPAPAATANGNARRREASLEAATRHAARGRALYAEQRDYEGAIDAYFQALHHSARADAYDPAMPSAGAGTRRLLAEFAAILRHEGEDSFASLLLRFYGLEPSEVPNLDPPQDEALVEEETEALQIRRTFGGAVRFLPSESLAPVRARVREQGPRFRVRVQVRTRIGGEQPPQLYAEGLWVRLEDREARTLSAPIRIAFTGGPYQRIVRVEARGRQVLPWDRSHPLDARPYAQQVREAAETLVAAAKR